jgi:hypothetical protein
LDYIAFDSLELFYVLTDLHVDYESPITQMMSLEEWRAFDALPDETTIYRGCGPMNEFGFCWTLDQAAATTYAFRPRYTAEYPTLITMTIKKEWAAATKLRGKTSEIILFDHEGDDSFDLEWTRKPFCGIRQET